MLYGVRLTLQDLLKLGPRALALDLIVISTVLLAGYWLGTRVLGLDRDTALLVSAGSGICGAAAVLATDRVIDSQSHKVSVAVATVVVFGTVAMFLYPVLYPLTGFTERQFGIYTGATVHEVAQALAAGRAVSQAASDTAVITKMLRVLLLAPVLLIVSRVRRGKGAGASRQIAFPWFVFWFGAVIAAQSAIQLARGRARAFDRSRYGAAVERHVRAGRRHPLASIETGRHASAAAGVGHLRGLGLRRLGDHAIAGLAVAEKGPEPLAHARGSVTLNSTEPRTQGSGVPPACSRARLSNAQFFRAANARERCAARLLTRAAQ